MSLRSWLDVFRNRTEPRRSRRSRRAADARRRVKRRLLVEGLEDRRVLTFVPAVDYPAGDNPQAVVAADFNNDGVQDLAVANYGASDVSVLLGNADGTFDSAVNFPTGVNPLSLAVGDFDDDGALDIATANSASNDVSVLLGINDGTGKGTGTFGGPTNIGIGSSPTSVAVGDFNGDGLLDLGVTSNVYHPGHFDPDTNYYYYGYNEGLASVLVGDNQGNFSAPNSTSIPYSHLTSAIAVNLDGTGADEFVAVNDYYGYYYGAVVILSDGGNDSLQLSNVLYTGADAVAVTAGYVNGDNALDLVTANGNYNSVSVLLSDGLGGFGNAESYAVGSYTSAVVIGNFNQGGGGKPDILVTSGSDLSVLYGQAGGTFAPAVNSAVGVNPFALTSGDFNGDGWLDAATANLNSHTVSVLLNDRSWPAAPASLSIGDVTVSEGNAGTVAASFVVTRSGDDLAGSATVHYSTSNGGATAGSDYVAASAGTLTFGPNETTKTITILVNGDAVDEFDEAFYVNLSVPTGAFLLDSQGAGTIVDDDLPPDIRISDQSRNEGSRVNTSFAFTVSLSAPSGKGVYVYFATADGTATVAGGDYFAQSSSVYIAPGQTTATLTVTVRADKSRESNETYFVNLTAATGGTIVDGQGVGTIVNDDRGSGKTSGKGQSSLSDSAGFIAALLADDDWATDRKRK